jgi:hypothetical protein
VSSTFRERVLAGETLFGCWAGLGSPMAAELAGRAGFDWVVIDLEHGAGNEGDLLGHLTAVEGTAPPSWPGRSPASGSGSVGRSTGAAGHISLDSTAEAREACPSSAIP